MVSTLWNNLITTYKLYIGTGSLLVLFVVALMYKTLHGLRNGKKISELLWPGILMPWGSIGMAFGELFLNREISEAVPAISVKNEKYVNAYKATIKIVIAVVLVYILIISGNRFVSPEFYVKADNNMHIDANLLKAMDFILADSETESIGVVTMPGAGEYFRSYSSRFDMMYEDPVDGDVSGLKKELNQTYQELSVKYPDMLIVSNAAKREGCRYIVIRNDSYWPKIPLTEYEYDLIFTCGYWDVYKCQREVYDNASD